MALKKFNIAVVDDDESFARALERLLRVAGFNSFIYNSAEAFLRDRDEVSAQCLVLDIHLRGMSGFELRRQLTAHATKTPVIFVTGHDDEEVREEAWRVGCSAYLNKPVQSGLLLDAINKAIISEPLA